MSKQSGNRTEQETPRDAVDLVAVLDMLWRSRALIGKLAGSIFALGLLYAWLAPPVYESSLLVQIQSDSDNVGTEQLGSPSSFFGVKSSDAAEMQILGSRQVIGDAVDQTRFYIEADPARFPLIGRWIADQRTSLSNPGLLGLGGYAWGSESIDVQQLDTPEVFYDDVFNLTVLDEQRYRLSSPDLPGEYVGYAGQTAHIATDDGEVTLRVNGWHAKPGTRFKLYRHSRQQIIADLQQSLAIVDQAKDAGVIAVSLQGTHAQRVTDLVAALGEAYVKQNGEQKSREAEKSLAFLEQQLPGMKKDLQKAEDTLLAYRNKHGAIDLSESAKLDMGQVVALQTRVSLLQQERQAKHHELTGEHPDIVSIDAQVALLKQQIKTVEAHIKRLPGTEQDVVRLMRDVKVNNDLYVAMLNSAQQLRVLRAGKVSNVGIVDHAELPGQPIKPRRALVVCVALLLGLLLGIGYALLRNLWRGSVTDPHEIEHSLDLPVQAIVPLSENQRQQDRLGRRRLHQAKANHPPLAVSHPREAAIEGLHGLSIAIQLLDFDSRGAIVAITSPTQDVGKSFVAMNLGVLLARAGKRVLLIDGDLRKGVLHRTFQRNEAMGLSNVLRGEIALAQAVQASDVEGLSLLSTGAKVTDASTWLQGAALGQCLRRAASIYDIVLIDTAPVLPAADTLWLAQGASKVYLVARYGVTSAGELIETRARLRRADVDIEGIVLNGVQSSLQGARYGQYGYQGYYSDAAGPRMEERKQRV
jgi:tyrosine-protein kinase Etk/Wzc